MIAPQVNTAFGGVRATQRGLGDLHYTKENYDFCESFVVDSALHLSRVNFSLWMPQTFGESAEAQDAAQANGGVLPTGWSNRPSDA